MTIRQVFRRSVHTQALLVWGMWLLVGFIALPESERNRAAAQSQSVTTVSAASYSAQAIAPDSIVASFGTNLATTTAVATDADPVASGIQLPTTLGGTTVEINGQRAGLFFVSLGQINYVIPPEVQPGLASVSVRSGNGIVSTGKVAVSAVAPAVFTANGDGKGVPAASLLRVKAGGALSYEPLADYDALQARFIPRPINLGPAGERVFLILFASGLRRAADPNNDGNANESVRLTVGGMSVTPAYAGRQGDYAGLDQINAELPRELLGRGVVDVTVTATGADPAQVVQIEMAVAVGGGQAPRAFDDSVITDEDASRAVTLRGDDANSRPLRYIVTRLPRLGRLGGSAPNLTYMPSANESGADDFAFKVNNGIENSNEATVTINVREVNDPPALSAGGARSGAAGQPLSFTVSATDVDAGQTLSFTAAGLPVGASLAKTSPTSAQFSWTPVLPQTGTYTVSFTVTDNGSPALSDTKTVSVTIGALFGKTSGPEGGDLAAFQVVGSNLFAATLGGGIYVTADNGRSWEEANRGLGNLFVRALAANGANLFAGTQGGVFASGDGGQNWAKVLDGSFSGLAVRGAKVFAFTGGAAAFVSSDNGRNWAQLGARLPLDIVYAAAASETHLFVGGQGGVLSSANDGQSWTPGLENEIVFALAVSGTKTFAGTVGGVRRSTDGGQSWTELRQGLPAFHVVFSLCASGAKVFASTNFGFYTSVNDGGNWTKRLLPGGDAYALALVGANLFAGTGGGGVAVSTNEGQGWAAANSGFASSVVTSLSVNGARVYAGTFAGVFTSSNDGKAWAQNLQSSSPGKVNTTLVSGGRVFAGTDDGIYVSTDNGQSWARSGLEFFIVTSLAASGTKLYAGAASLNDFSGNGVYVSTDNGQTWKAGSVNFSRGSISALAVNGTRLYAASGTPPSSGGAFTIGDGVFVSNNDGQTWTSISAGLPDRTNANALLLSGGKLFVGMGDSFSAGAGLFVLNDDGQSWRASGSGIPAGVSVRAFAVSDTRLFAGTLGGVFVSTNQGQQWAAVNTGLTGVAVYSLAVSGVNLYAGTYSSGVFISGNGGQSWAGLNAGLNQPYVNTVVVNGARLFAGTLGDGVYRSTDRGQNWTRTSAGLPPASSVQALVFSGTQLLAATDGGGIYRSANDGQNWTASNTGLTNLRVSSLVVQGAALLAGTYGGGVFRSIDGGANWAAVNTGLTNQTVLTLAVNGTILLAGTDGGGVFRSANGGQAWQASNAGLATLDVRSLMVSGTTLFAGTLSGGIFRSRDGGANWTPINADLPQRLPVFSFVTSGEKLYVGTVYGVFVSTDQGASWRQINAGLLNIFVTALAVDGDKLIAGTQGGGAFVSQIPN